MLPHQFYYTLKPFMPWSARMALRRVSARRKLAASRDVWPIDDSTRQPPPNWPGWPEGKRFAVVLTHDVEGPAGLAKCRKLMELERRLGFRSSFNLIPEGAYRVPAEFRAELTVHGFELGVHDLKHDGKLFRSKRAFERSATQINHYLHDWNASGFRSGFMLRNLDWVHGLDLCYDSSTFDTDPFEFQPDGAGTIFPFWIPAPDRAGAALTTPGTNGTAPQRAGYVELPYTLPQDSTLFLVLRETSPAIWLRKLDWVAAAGGMALVNVHPDYIQFEDEPASARTYPVAHYLKLLEHIQTAHAGTYWQALPKQVAQLVHESPASIPDRPVTGQRSHRATSAKPKIWIDLDNTPHVPFFEPIIDELKSRGFPLFVTARDAFQVCELADKKGLKYVKVGRHYGKNRLRKGLGLAFRAMQLLPFALREKPVLGVSHGARSLLLVGNALRIPTLLIEDYEFSQFPAIMRPTWVMAPEAIPDEALACREGHSRKYPGIKEDVYAWKLQPDPRVLRELGIDSSELVVTVRPPATEAHYHNPESEKLFERFMNRAATTPATRVVLLPRNQRQEAYIRQTWPQWFANRKTVIPAALDGLNLMWHSDLVFSGGGTMNREAAALGVPVYSIFRGTIGAVDRHLNAERRLTLIESLDDVDQKIRLEKRERPAVTGMNSSRSLEVVVGTIIEIAERCAR